MRAGAKAMKERGFISEYQRITTLQDDRRHPAVGHRGQGAGADRHRLAPRDVLARVREGRARRLPLDDIVPSGPVAGGHAVLVNGVNVPRQTFRILNSWGLDWGVDGRASMRFSDMDDLLFSQGGDAWMYVEKRPTA